MHKVLVPYLAVFKGEEDLPHINVRVVERYQVLRRNIASKVLIFLMQPSDIAE